MDGRGGIDDVTNVRDYRQKLTTDIVAWFGDMVRTSTQSVNETASLAQAGTSSLTFDTAMQGFIKSSEDLLTLTRKLKELWVVGPLLKPGEGADEALAEMRTSAQQQVAILNKLKSDERRREVNELVQGVKMAAADPGCFRYVPPGPGAPKKRKISQGGVGKARGGATGAVVRPGQGIPLYPGGPLRPPPVGMRR